eukprot:gene17075-8593_t
MLQDAVPTRFKKIPGVLKKVTKEATNPTRAGSDEIAGYFFIEGLSGVERANLVSICIQRLTDTGVKIVSLTCDGPSCHFAMLRELGACLNPESLSTSFPHPLIQGDKIHVFLDWEVGLKLQHMDLAAKALAAYERREPLGQDLEELE